MNNIILFQKIHSWPKKGKNSAIRNCWISVRGAIKLHSFGTSAEQSEERIPNWYNFIAPQVLIQQLYYQYFILLLNYRAIFDTSAE